MIYSIDIHFFIFIVHVENKNKVTKNVKFMGYISYSFPVDLTTDPARSFPNKKDFKEPFYPYKHVVVRVNEVHFCPFCGKTVQGLSCSCRAFSKAFSALQASYSDGKSKAKLHHPEIFNCRIGIVKHLSDFESKKLDKEEIISSGLNLWDDASRI